MDKVLHSSEFQEWETPADIFSVLDREFNFTLDPCASPRTAKCSKYYTVEDDGLRQDWGGETVFINPPFGDQVKSWVKKAYHESQKAGTVVVMLIKNSTGTNYWFDYIWGKAADIRFLNGRLKFKKNGEKVESAPFDSAIVVFDKEKEGEGKGWGWRVNG